MINNKCLSIEFGNSNIKMLSGVYKNSKLYIKGYSLLPIPAGVISNGYIESMQQLGDIINHEIASKHLSGQRVVFVISSSAVITREIQLPYSSEREVEMIIRNEAAQFLPVDLREYVYDYKILESISTGETPLTKVLLVALPIKLADGYMELAKLIKRRVKAIDIQVNCISKLLTNKNGIELTNISSRQSQQNFAVFDIGMNAVNVSIFTKGVLKFTRFIQGGIRDVIPIINNEVRFQNEGEIYNAFGRVNLNPEASATEQLIMRNTIIDMFNDINRFIEFYSSLDSMDMLSNIYIYGGGSRINGIEEEISKYFGIQTERLQMGSDIIYKGKNIEDFKKHFIFLLNALGALIR